MNKQETKHNTPSVEEWLNGASFSSPHAPKPEPPKQGETYAQYRFRVKQCVELGFHLGDLSQNEWIAYCKGGGNYEGADSNDLVR